MSVHAIRLPADLVHPHVHPGVCPRETVGSRPKWMPGAFFSAARSADAHYFTLPGGKAGPDGARLHRNLRLVEGEFCVWGGLFRRQVFRAVHAISGNGAVIPKDSKVIFAWTGRIGDAGEVVQQKLWEGLLKSDYTHYLALFWREGERREHTVFLERGFVERKLL